MRINEQLKILDEEIEELNAYSGSKKIERLTKLGAYLLPPSLVFGFFGVNTLVWDDYVGEIVGWILTPAVIALAIASIPLTKCVIRLIEQYKRRSPKPSIKENA
jgi:Mg2+ and Co2+ transporter CorA